MSIVDCIIAEQVPNNDVCDKCNRLRVNDLMELDRNQQQHMWPTHGLSVGQVREQYGEQDK